MTEHCKCGASFTTERYKHLKEWRKEHKEYHPKEVADKSGSEASTERATTWDYDNNKYTAKIGFTLNEENENNDN